MGSSNVARSRIKAPLCQAWGDVPLATHDLAACRANGSSISSGPIASSTNISIRTKHTIYRINTLPLSRPAAASLARATSNAERTLTRMSPRATTAAAACPASPPCS